MTIRSLFAALILCAPLASPAQAPITTDRAPMPAGHPPVGASPHARAAPSPWAEMADYTLTVKVPPKGDSATWKIRAFADAADVIIDFDTPAKGGRTRGTVMLVSGQGIAIKGFTPDAGFEVDSLDVAVVNLKVLTQLLDAAAPAGPAAVKGRIAVDTKDAKSTIFASTPTANATFRAPWTLKGSVERKAGDAVAFSLALEAPGEKPGTRATWHYTGSAAGSAKGRVLDGATSLAGWTAYNLAPREQKPGHTTLRFGATRLDGPFATIKDLRAHLATIPPPPPPKPIPAKKP